MPEIASIVLLDWAKVGPETRAPNRQFKVQVSSSIGESALEEGTQDEQSVDKFVIDISHNWKQSVLQCCYSAISAASTATADLQLLVQLLKLVLHLTVQLGVPHRILAKLLASGCILLPVR